MSLWLDKLYGGESVPQYEINTRTVDILYDLMRANQRQDERAAALVADDLMIKADEYSAESENKKSVI